MHLVADLQSGRLFLLLLQIGQV